MFWGCLKNKAVNYLEKKWENNYIYIYIKKDDICAAHELFL
jgi:hypothetical protein